MLPIGYYGKTEKGELTMLTIRLAEKHEFDAVRSFYHSLIDAMEQARYKPAWEKDVYPSNEALREAIDRGELFVGMVEEEISCAMVVNHAFNESYADARWPTAARPDEITVIHILGVHPDFSGRGLAKALVAKAIGLAEEAKQKAIRLDVLAGNIPAERLYAGQGFSYVDTIRMYYEDTGWTDFKLYEYRLRTGG